MTFHMNTAYIDELVHLLCWGETVNRRAVDKEHHKEHNFGDITSELALRKTAVRLVSMNTTNKYFLCGLKVFSTLLKLCMASLRIYHQ